MFAFFRVKCIHCFFRSEFRYCLSHFQNEKVTKSFAGENSQKDGVRLMLLNMLDVLQKELTELKAYENKEKEKHMLEENIRKIQTNHQEEIKTSQAEQGHTRVPSSPSSNWTQSI